MTPERWQAIERILLDALNRPEASRSFFVKQACGDDQDLAREVLEMLAAHEVTSPLLDRPAWSPISEATRSMVLEAGSKLGPYQLGAPLGAGGMGTVYEAEDTRLGRKVAIKISHAEYSERFQREARAIAALNHPNICTLHDVGPNYLVMELVEGETLKQRIARGKIPVEEVLRFGCQTADALAAAHARGIVHRDLKPANVMLTQNGVKVLDFGLARQTGAETLTRSEVIMGTPAYMAPEQAQGRDAGPQADLFALGLMLYEMANGKLPMPGLSLGSALVGASSFRIPPLPGKSFRGLNKLIQRLLQLEPEKRPQTAAEVREELLKLSARPEPALWLRLASGVAAVFVLGIAVWFAYPRLFAGPAIGPATGIVPITGFRGNEMDPSFSPDGKFIAFSWVGEQGETYHIYTIPVGAQTPRRITDNPADEEWPVWSPDGTTIAFLRRSIAPNWQVVLYPVQGGAERVIATVQLYIPQSSGSYQAMSWTPDSKHLLLVHQGGEQLNAIWLLSIEDAGLRRLPLQGRPTSDYGDMVGLASPVLSPSGHWLAFLDSGQPRVQELAAGYQPIGKPIAFPMHAHDNIQPQWLGERLLLSWRDSGSVCRILLWDLHGPVQTLWAGRSLRRGITVSDLDGKVRIITAQGETGNSIWAMPLNPATHVASGLPTPRLQSPNFEALPEFSFDGSKLAWLSSRTGSVNVWVANADGSNQRLLSGRATGTPHWFRDGRLSVFDTETRALMVMDIESGAFRPLGSAALSLAGVPSADSAYSLTTTANTLALQRLADGSSIPIGPGVFPQVSRDGKRLVYLKLHDGLYSRSMAGGPQRNPEQLLVKDLVFGGGKLSLSDTGAYYLAETPEGRIRAFRYYDFATRTAKNVIAPPPLDSQQMPYGQIAVPPNQKEILFSAPNGTTDLMMLEFEARK
jgi:Tol biopolymer transport system component